MPPSGNLETPDSELQANDDLEEIQLSLKSLDDEILIKAASNEDDPPRELNKLQEVNDKTGIDGDLTVPPARKVSIFGQSNLNCLDNHRQPLTEEQYSLLNSRGGVVVCVDRDYISQEAIRLQFKELGIEHALIMQSSCSAVVGFFA